jgi:signal transduction histidine kinase
MPDQSIQIDDYDSSDYSGVDGVDLARFKASHADEAEAVRQALIAQELEYFEKAVNDLSMIEGFDFYISAGAFSISPLSALYGPGPRSAALFKSRPAYMIYEGGHFTKSPPAPARYRGIESSLEGALRNYHEPALSVYMSFDERFISQRAESFALVKAHTYVLLAIILGAGLLSLLMFVFLVAATGRRGENGRICLSFFDRVPAEAKILMAALLVVGCVAAGNKLMALYWSHGNYEGYYFGWIPGGGVNALDAATLILPAAAILSICLCFALSVVRTLKARMFLRLTLVWRVCAAVCRWIHVMFDAKNPMGKVALITLAVSILSATVALAPLVIALVLALAPRWVRKYAEIKRGVAEVKSGNLAWRIPVSDGERGEFDELARDINDISRASAIAVQNELKNQRLKTDLISNVSHDLKTPLTSIITYVDLIRREGLDSPSAPGYLAILEQKSQRLQKLTEDLFDAAKASSGAMPVRLGRVDLLSLIRQGLGEMDSSFAATRLDVILNAEKDRHYVSADGQLLWRIVENLMNNVQKYAMEGSRVYIDISEREASGIGTTLEMKNVSRAPLNIPPDELMERFKRGDESRATDGSGLGLAIAKDLARLQNGWFEVKIDGDLFKAVLMLETWKEPAAAAGPAAATA